MESEYSNHCTKLASLISLFSFSCISTLSTLNQEVIACSCARSHFVTKAFRSEAPFFEPGSCLSLVSVVQVLAVGKLTTEGRWSNKIKTVFCVLFFFKFVKFEP